MNAGKLDHDRRGSKVDTPTVTWMSMSQLALLDGDHTHSMKGTPYFMAPEVLGVSKYGRRAVRSVVLTE
jgi:hypothetical protein